MKCVMLSVVVVASLFTAPAYANCKGVSPQGSWTYGGFGGPCDLIINKAGKFKNATCEIAQGGEVYYIASGSLKINANCSAQFEIEIRRATTKQVVDFGTAYGAYVIADGDLVGATIQWEGMDTTFFQLMRRP